MHAMTEFHPEDFRESIDDMCDAAIRRMYAIQEGGLGAMQPGDEYLSTDMCRDERLEVIEYSTRLRTTIIDGIHRDLVERFMPDYTLEILSGAVVSLAKHAAFKGRGSTVIVPEHDSARSHVVERTMLQHAAIQEGGPVHVYTQELGSLGLVSLMLERDHAWSLNYTSQRRTALIRW